MLEEAYREVTRATSQRLSRSTLITVIASSMIATQLAFRAWAVYGGWFFGDDFVFLADVAQGKADLAWIFHRHNVHFMPLGFLLVLPVAHAGAFAWNVAATEMLLTQALASLGCWIMLRNLFGNRVKILIPLAFYLFSAMSMPALMWWAAGMNMLTVQPAIFGAIIAHVLFLRTRHKRFAFLAALSLAIAMSAYVKALMIPVVLGIFTLCYFAEGKPLQRSISTLKRFWFAWVLYGVLGSVYLFAYFRIGESPRDDGKVNYAELIQHAVVANLGTGLLGGPWQWLTAAVENGPRVLSDPSQLLQTLAISTILLTLLYLACRYQGALTPLWFVVPCVIVTVGLLAGGRVATFGTGITMEIRYWTDTLPYFALAIGLMCMPLLGATQSLKPRDPPILTVAAPRWLKAGFAVVFIAGSLYSSVTYVRPWHEDFLAKSWTQSAEAELTSRTGTVAIADGGVPEAVMQGIANPYNLNSVLLSPLSKEFRTPDVGTDLSVFNGFGQIVRGIATPDLEVPPATLTTCLVAPSDDGPASIALGSTTFDYPFWLSMKYRSNSDSTITLVAGKNWRQVPIKSGLHTLFARTVGSYDRVDLYLRPGTTLCVESLRVGKQVVPE